MRLGFAQSIVGGGQMRPSREQPVIAEHGATVSVNAVACACCRVRQATARSLRWSYRGTGMPIRRCGFENSSSSRAPADGGAPVYRVRLRPESAAQPLASGVQVSVGGGGFGVRGFEYRARRPVEPDLPLTEFSVFIYERGSSRGAKPLSPQDPLAVR